MTINLGRYRQRWSWCPSGFPPSGFPYLLRVRRRRFPEGTVYRLWLGPLFIKCLVDTMTPSERARRAQAARQQLAQWRQ